MTDPAQVPEEDRRKHEIGLFLFLIVFLFPLVTFMVVGGYGFGVWMFQELMGPPGPPAG
ncbi:nitrate reductase [Halovibrio salipaludis]|uniref:Nitrate reductase n=1 Tax=Halovibrio salipaludis TaxID=2032626 RepID=A0A2A2F728_9GAMM|nr:MULTISPECIES: nitrate reductase [Gammaproteobacteria]KAA8985206.1 nitrate reductase [Halospina sp. K52047b]PAU80748.1 nitrate reductase [Halovibrio salipaludis]